MKEGEPVRILVFAGDLQQWLLRSDCADFLGVWRNYLHSVPETDAVYSEDGIALMGYVPSR